MDEVTLRIYRIDLGEDIWISATSPEEAVRKARAIEPDWDWDDLEIEDVEPVPQDLELTAHLNGVDYLGLPGKKGGQSAEYTKTVAEWLSLTVAAKEDFFLCSVW